MLGAVTGCVLIIDSLAFKRVKHLFTTTEACNL